MAETMLEPCYWAILIGINFYPNPDETHLRGSVHDVQHIQQFLASEPENWHTRSFTASMPPNPNSHQPPETPDIWPTLNNIMACFRDTLQKAKEGDSVYIHFSGHGTTETPGSVALVLFDESKGSCHLRGKDLANFLKDMVEAGLLVTLVLDCCFSGGVLRNNDRIRTIDYRQTMDEPCPLEPRADIQTLLEPIRDANLLPDWIVNPRGYSILSACGEHETARELTVHETKCGALSYFLIRALSSLRKRQVAITRQSFYEHLCVMFHAHCPSQNPMLFGNAKIVFLRSTTSKQYANFTPVYREKTHNCLRLDAGSAHGVSNGDGYALYPFATAEDVWYDVKRAPVRVKVGEVCGLTSELICCDSSTSVAMGKVETGWKAKPLTQISPRKIPVRLTGGDFDTIPEGPFLRLWTKHEGESYMFNAAVNDKEEAYEILDTSDQNIPHLPKIPRHRNTAATEVCRILDHLTTFKYFEGIENRIPRPEFENSFKIDLKMELKDKTQVALKRGGFIHVDDSDKLVLSLQNLGSQSLYLALFDLRPSWEICSLLHKEGNGDFKVIAPKVPERKSVIKWNMSVPKSHQHHGFCEDVIKIFVTNRPTSFTHFKLRKLSASLEDLDETTRGSHTLLSEFMAEITPQYRDTGDTTRENWFSQNFLIRTSVKKECPSSMKQNDE